MEVTEVTSKRDVEAQEATDMPMVLLKRLNEMAAKIPEGHEDTGQVRILETILGAKSAEELGDPWALAGGEALANVPLRVDTIKRRPSDFEDGINVFLICAGVRLDTKAPVTFSTGATSVVAQLVMAYDQGWLPLFCTFRLAKKPTPRGYYPQHLEMQGSEEPF
jgi:hypothetical protein